jgi:hypothetical protein
MEEQQAGFKMEEIPKDTLILVGFGKHSLEDVMGWIGTEREIDALEASIKWPPRYRELRICDKEDVERFMKYTEYVSSTGFRGGVVL